jgi:regulator of sigma E protease
MELLIFIGAIAALIFIHELGHFLVARLLKVDVEEFGLGFPPGWLSCSTGKARTTPSTGSRWVVSCA